MKVSKTIPLIIVAVVLLGASVLAVGCGGEGVSETTVATADTQIINGGSYVVFPSGGVSIEAGKTLILSWSADGNLDCFIFTETQFSNFELSYALAGPGEASASGWSGTIGAPIQNDDTYYAVLRNPYSYSTPSLKLYEATLKLR